MNKITKNGIHEHAFKILTRWLNEAFKMLKIKQFLNDSISPQINQTKFFHFQNKQNSNLMNPQITDDNEIFLE